MADRPIDIKALSVELRKDAAWIRKYEPTNSLATRLKAAADALEQLQAEKEALQERETQTALDRDNFLFERDDYKAAMERQISRAEAAEAALDEIADFVADTGMTLGDMVIAMRTIARQHLPENSDG